MSYDAKVFNVMVASPSDVDEERKLAREAILLWNVTNAETHRRVLLPIAWETHSHPEMGDRPQGIINKQLLSRCDLLVAIFWTKIGTPTGKHESGTVEEIEEHIKTGKPAMIYFSSAPASLESLNPAQYEQLTKFKSSCKTRGLLEDFSTPAEFRMKFERQLHLKIAENDYFRTAGGSENDYRSATPAVPLLPEAQRILSEAAKSPQGHILVLTTREGIRVETNGKRFVEEGGPRARALWQAAIRQLTESRLIYDTTGEGKVFQVSHEGYAFADKQHASLLPDSAVTKAFLAIPWFSPEQIYADIQEIRRRLLAENITDPGSLTEMVADAAIKNIITDMYITELKRPSDSPFDPRALATWGGMLFRQGTQPAVIEKIRSRLRNSPEWRQKNQQS